MNQVLETIALADIHPIMIVLPALAKFILSELATLCKKYPYSELFWSLFSRIRTEYREIHRFSPYSVRMRENKDQNNFEYKHFSRSAKCFKMPLANA